jgi:thioredoxin reductase
VLFAIGAMEYPRRLNIPGEDLLKVRHRFVDPYAYVRKEALVVGGGNSAAEAALFLSEEGARTTMAIWREDWENRDPKAGAMKHWVRSPLEREIDEGRLRVILYKQIDEITYDSVRLTTEDGESMTISNDVVFVLIGAGRPHDAEKARREPNRESSPRFPFMIRKRLKRTCPAFTWPATLLTRVISRRLSTCRAKSFRCWRSV